MKLSKEARENLESITKDIIYMLKKKIPPYKVLELVKIEDIEEILFYFTYLRETKREWLIDKLKK